MQITHKLKELYAQKQGSFELFVDILVNGRTSNAILIMIAMAIHAEMRVEYCQLAKMPD